MTRPHSSVQAAVPAMRTRPATAVILIVVGLGLLVLALALSISVGARQIPLAIVWEALTRFNKDLTEHQIVWELRFPRAIAAALVGAALAVAGSIMQGITRNPLADPGLLGVNAGAGLAIAICLAFYPALSFNHLTIFSFAGAAFATALVYGISSMARGGSNPVRLALAGTAITAWLAAISEGIALHFRIGQDITRWFAGGVAGAKWSQIDVLLPWIGAGLVCALLLSRSVTLLSLGEEVAAGLGIRIGWIKIACAIVVLVLAGASVSIAGMISFVGLMVPHLARYLVGVSYKWIIPLSGVLGALLLVLADIGSRVIRPDTEVQVGLLIALIGVPVFVYLARRERRRL